MCSGSGLVVRLSVAGVVHCGKSTVGSRNREAKSWGNTLKSPVNTDFVGGTGITALDGVLLHGPWHLCRRLGNKAHKLPKSAVMTGTEEKWPPASDRRCFLPGREELAPQ